MKKILISCGVIIASFLIIFTVFLINTDKSQTKKELLNDNKSKINSVKTEKTNQQTKEITNEDEPEFFTIKFDGNKTNVYDKNDNIIRSLDIDFPSLREYDKSQLKQGVTVYSIDEVNEFAEDFTG